MQTILITLQALKFILISERCTMKNIKELLRLDNRQIKALYGRLESLKKQGYLQKVKFQEIKQNGSHIYFETTPKLENYFDKLVSVLDCSEDQEYIDFTNAEEIVLSFMLELPEILNDIDVKINKLQLENMKKKCQNFFSKYGLNLMI
ncbi:MAG: hypothetical protein ACTSR8_11970 [Promethearchaeota archaeon]